MLHPPMAHRPVSGRNSGNSDARLMNLRLLQYQFYNGDIYWRFIGGAGNMNSPPPGISVQMAGDPPQKDFNGAFVAQQVQQFALLIRVALDDSWHDAFNKIPANH